MADLLTVELKRLNLAAESTCIASKDLNYALYEIALLLDKHKQILRPIFEEFDALYDQMEEEDYKAPFGLKIDVAKLEVPIKHGKFPAADVMTQFLHYNGDIGDDFHEEYDKDLIEMDIDGKRCVIRVLCFKK